MATAVRPSATRPGCPQPPAPSAAFLPPPPLPSAHFIPSPAMPPSATQDNRDLELLDQLVSARTALVEQIGRRIVGQARIVDDLVAALLAGGHVLLVGVPGLAKTLLVQ